MRNMSFSLTEPQLMDGSKTVTRRLGWEFLRAGDRVCAVRKAMGLKKGEKVHRLCVLEIVSVRREPLRRMRRNRYYGWLEIRREGFPLLSPAEFVAMFAREMKCSTDALVTRIEFRRVDERDQW